MKSLLLKSLVAFVLVVNFSTQVAQGQAVGTWQAYMSYQDARMVAIDSKGYVYAVFKGYYYGDMTVAVANRTPLSDGSLLRYDPLTGEIKTFSKANGLNDVYILRIAYVESEKVLVIVYDNGNIDMYDTDKDIVYNLADIKTNPRITDKTVNSIDVYGEYAYLSMNSGIFAVDVKNKVLKDYYQLNKKTYSVCFWKDNASGKEYIYAATNDSIKRADIKSNLSSSSSWVTHKIPTYTNNDQKLITKVLNFNDSLVFCQATGTGAGPGIYYQATPAAAPQKLSSLPTISATVPIHQIAILNNKLVFAHNNANNANIYSYSSLKATPTVTSAPDAVYVASRNSSTYWLARGYTGISKLNDLANPIVKNSPKRNVAYNMAFSQGKLLVVGGGFWASRSEHPGIFMVMEKDNDKTWLNLDEDALKTTLVSSGLYQNATPFPRDFMCPVVDPRDENRFIVCAYTAGLFEFRSNLAQKRIDFVTTYDDRNTNGKLERLASWDTSLNRNYTWVASLAFDAQANLYITSAAENAAMTICTKDNVWTNYPIPSLAGRTILQSLIITKNNQKWVASAREHDGGLFVLNDNNTINNTSDDKYFFSKDFTDQDGKKLNITFFNCISEDLNGTIWVGTDIGPIVFYNPLSITAPGSTGFDSCSRTKMPRNDGTDNADYLLDGIAVSTIAVDSANRKWIGTKGAGVFLVSPAGDEVLANFTAENSPLLSDDITKIVINGENGEVFIGTDKGIISYMGIATDPSANYSSVYAYPNPVKPDFDGNVVVTGLVKDSNVRITDLNGNIMFQGTSFGGQFMWNCKNRFGERVKTGVYLVFAATADGTLGVVSKIVVVK